MSNFLSILNNEKPAMAEILKQIVDIKKQLPGLLEEETVEKEKLSELEIQELGGENISLSTLEKTEKSYEKAKRKVETAKRAIAILKIKLLQAFRAEIPAKEKRIEELAQLRQKIYEQTTEILKNGALELCALYAGHIGDLININSLLFSLPYLSEADKDFIVNSLPKTVASITLPALTLGALDVEVRKLRDDIMCIGRSGGPGTEALNAINNVLAEHNLPPEEDLGDDETN